jgi:hypothetical protein
MKIAIGCDHGALELKNVMVAHLEKQGHQVKDFGTYTKDSCDYPEFAAAAGKLDAAMDETDKHPDAKLTERDDLWMTYSVALALEMYLAGTRDGGRVCHAFITGELPAIQKREEEKHEQTNA